MAIMCVDVEELLYQVATGHILVLKFLLLGAHGRMWPCPVAPGFECHCFLRA
jgi:hypothetical protein